ncbi:ABC transporter permease [Clostridium oryzae]|uniref:FtsX-like permease family protein n=1 Tax=Clostridium oryzae TaxID=1450648 RepID=A0A1V4IL33_9CLOT|nr:FtsX-like permease family protein [Clostridium oryzae]OPJ60742.1 FtsX-like permease family protein [Clostridium oryzae]
MNYLNVFRLYNLKKMKKEKLLIFFTLISILITSTLSIVVPIVALNLKNYNENNIKAINGGMLSIYSNCFSREFIKELNSLDEGKYKVTLKGAGAAFFKNKDGRKIYANIILGENGLKNNQIIIAEQLAKNISLSAGDKITVINEQLGAKTYDIKAIEESPMAVSSDDEIISYAKIAEKSSRPSRAYIQGKGNGEYLKRQLKLKDSSCRYFSIKDRKAQIKSKEDMEIGTLGILTTMAYILSSVTMVSTCLILIVRRKRDIAIMKLMSIENRDIRKALGLEMLIIVGIPVIISLVSGVFLVPVILRANYAGQCVSLIIEIAIGIKGILLNIMFFLLVINIPFTILKGIKGISILRENEEDLNRLKKRTFILLLLIMPVIIVAYSIYIGSGINLGMSLGILVVIGLFLIICSVIIKLLTSIPFRNNAVIYTFKNVKKNFMMFSLIALSLAITVSFILVSVLMGRTIKNNVRSTLKKKLPYNYLLQKSDKDDVKGVLTKSNGVKAYTKCYVSAGKIENHKIEDGEIELYGIKQKDYKLKFKLVDGKNLDFRNDNGCLITTNYEKTNKLKVGDMLKIQTERGERNFKITGVYDNSFVNSNGILAPYSGGGKREIYFISSNGHSWMNKINNSPIIAINTLGNSLSQFIERYIKLFKILSLMVIFSSLLFNVNIVYITASEERKQDAIIRALGLGKSFIFVYYVIKQIMLIIMSAVIACSFYSLLSKAICNMLGIKQAPSQFDVFIAIAAATILCIVSFIMPVIKANKKADYELLREN